ncbi:MAG: hypothetical protein IKY64_06280 [Bacteroidaceae bacterium]|nr:hypothetical protein [Bacteroidaceae bacterium]
MKRSPIIAILLLSVSWFASCEREIDFFDVSPTMEAYYIESIDLPSVTLDSVKLFVSKVNNFTADHPEAYKHEKYPLICENVKRVTPQTYGGLYVDTAWVYEYIYY